MIKHFSFPARTNARGFPSTFFRHDRCGRTTTRQEEGSQAAASQGSRLLVRTLLVIFGLLGLGSNCQATETDLRNLEQQDPDVVYFAKHLAKLADSANDASFSNNPRHWLIPKRSDQLVIYFLHDNKPNVEEPFGKLRQQRAVNLLQHAARAAEADQMDQAYKLFWQAAREDPGNAKIMHALGLPADGDISIKVQTARGIDRQLNWPARSYLQVLSPHFEIVARCTQQQAKALAEQLEHVYWIWTQVFYPLWENKSYIRSGVAANGRFEPRVRRHRVVMFADRQQYIETLAPQNPGIERSTGYYSNQARTTFLYHAPRPDIATRFHEMTHQLIGEASNMRVSAEAGLPNDFWVIEGIASYMESLRFFDTYATVGGWESSRLAFARHRLLGTGQSMPLQRLVADGRDAVQQSPDIAKWYTFAAAYTHAFMSDAERNGFFAYVRSCYERPHETRTLRDVDLASFLNVTDSQVQSLRPDTQVEQLCLVSTSVTHAGFAALSELKELSWLDLTGLPLDDSAIAAMIRANPKIEQLSLERTGVSSRTCQAIGELSALQELDLTLTRVGDNELQSLAKLRNLQTLWLTATQVGDATLDVVSELPNLSQLDVQRTGVTDAAIERLRKDRPELQLNPLRIISESQQ
ncbi:MAG: hypothetical protein R3C05_27810 [Pirellulaceae bacterium]